MKRILKYLLPWERVKNVSLLIGKLIGRLLPFNNKSGLFFFFPFYQVGGAEKIHAEIVACVAERKPWVFFTNRSKDQKFRSLFERNASIIDLSFLTIGSIIYYGYVGALAAFINRHERPVVFGCNSVFFYHLIRHLSGEARRIDMIHAFGGGIEHASLPSVSEVDTRVIYSSKVFSELKHQYASEGLDLKLLDRITTINNHVMVPDKYPEKRRNDRLKVLYVGRGAKEKRVHIVGRAAERCHRLSVPADFILVGDLSTAVEAVHHSYCIFKGEIADLEELNLLYAEADVLVLTSSSEGFPMVIMEAMAYGVVTVSTDVGGISDHVHHNINGILIKAEEEDRIADIIVEELERLIKDRTLLKKMSHDSYEYARQNFLSSKFCAAYRQLLLGEKASL